MNKMEYNNIFSCIDTNFVKMSASVQTDASGRTTQLFFKRRYNFHYFVPFYCDNWFNS